MDRSRNGHNEWSKSDRETEISYDITYVQKLLKSYKWTYLQYRNILTDLENKVVVTREEGWREE